MLSSIVRVGGLAALIAVLASCTTASRISTVPASPTVRYEAVSWSRVPGWKADASHEAWGAFIRSCEARTSQNEWREVCAQARGASIDTAAQARQFFEGRFTAYRIVQLDASQRRADTGLITGYYEPLLRGSRTRSAVFNTPLYAPPDDMLTIDLGELYPELRGKRVRGRLQGRKVVPYYDRAALHERASLRGKELVWVDSAVDAFFLEVQGSGRVQLNDGQILRVAYADQNGHPYRSIGRYLVDRGELTLEESTAQSIRQWLADHPTRLREVLDANPSTVFFAEERIADPTLGPKGSLGVLLTPGRSIAIDPQFIPPGAAVFIDTTWPDSGASLQRLVVAQDTGGAIRGAIRADLFWGFGAEAEKFAGLMKQQGALWLLWPKDQPAPTPRG